MKSATYGILKYLKVLPFVVLIPALAFAQNMVTDFDEKFRLEKAISERLEQTLKTRLEKQYFDITVEVQLGVARHITNGETLDPGKTIELDTVSITLGLSDRVQEAYREDLKIWLQKWAKTSFAEKGSINLVVRPSNIAKRMPSSLSSGFDLSKYQNLIGLIFLGVIFSFAFIHQFFRNRARDAQEMPPKRVALTTTSGLQQDLLPPVVEAKTLLESLKTKIVLIAPGLQHQIEFMVQKWSYGETQNYMKIVALLEALAERGPSLNRESKASIPSLPPHMHAQLAKGLSELQILNPESQISLYQEIYTELLIGSPLAIESIDPELKFLESLSNDEFSSLLGSLDDSYKVALLNHLTSEQRRQFSELVSSEEFTRILNHTLICEEPTETEFKEKIQHWKKHKSHISRSDLHLRLAKLQEVLSSFSRLDGAKWLYQLALKHPEIKKPIQEEGPHLAFIGDWPSETLRKFCQSTKTRELAAAAKCLPFLSSTLLGGCGEVTRMAVETEMLKLDDPQKLLQSFEHFVISFDTFVESYKLNPTTLITSPSAKSPLKNIA